MPHTHIQPDGGARRIELLIILQTILLTKPSQTPPLYKHQLRCYLILTINKLKSSQKIHSRFRKTQRDSLGLKY